MSVLVAWIRNGADAGLRVFYPGACQIYGPNAHASQGYKCPRCWAQQRFIEPPFCELCDLPCSAEDALVRKAKSGVVCPLKFHPFQPHGQDDQCPEWPRVIVAVL